MSNDGTGANWDETAPADSDSIANGALEIRDLRVGIADRLGKEHAPPSSSSAGGEHENGSARAYIASSFPTLRPDGTTALSSSDDGRLFVRTTDGTLYYIDSSGAWQAIKLAASSQLADGIVGTDQLAAAGAKASKFAVLSHTETDTTDGGTFTSGAWRTVTLNTETSDVDEFVSLSSNQFTLDAGTYRIEFWSNAYACGHHQARVRNTTDSTTLIYGSTEQSSTSVMTKSVGSYEFTLTGTKVFELQHRCETTNSGDGLGTNGGFGGNELYAQVKIWKVG